MNITESRSLVVPERVRMALGMLGEQDRLAVERAIGSTEAVSALLRASKPVGKRGGFRVAEVGEGLRLIMEESPQRVKLMELLSKEAFDTLRLSE